MPQKCCDTMQIEIIWDFRHQPGSFIPELIHNFTEEIKKRCIIQNITSFKTQNVYTG